MSPLLDNVNASNKSKSIVENIYEPVLSTKKLEGNNHYEPITIKGHNNGAESTRNETIIIDEIKLRGLSLLRVPVDSSRSDPPPHVTRISSGIYEEINSKDMKPSKEEEDIKEIVSW